LNSEPVEDEFHSQFHDLMGESMKGRTDTLKGSSKYSGGARTGSTAASDNFNNTDKQYKPSLMHPIIVESNEILETSIDPIQWKKECERVRSQLSLKIQTNQNGTKTVFEHESEETY
jgi:hypothetical protein